MTILSVVQAVSSVIGVMRPQALFPTAGSDRTARELADLANEMAQRIAYDTRDWNILTASATGIFGDGTRQSFPLPANYKRLLLTSQVWRSTSTVQPLRFIPDPNEWLQRRLRGHIASWGEWALLGTSIYIQPVLAAGESAQFLYLQKNCVTLASGGLGAEFMADGDTFLLDERLLKLGMIWQWKANKGSPYAEDMANYETAIANVRGADRPAPILVDRMPISAATSVAYPYPIVIGPGGVPV